MTVDTNDVISTVNDLIETSIDGEQGYRTCADGVSGPNLKVLLLRKMAAGNARACRPSTAGAHAASSKFGAPRTGDR